MISHRELSTVANDCISLRAGQALFGQSFVKHLTSGDQHTLSQAQWSMKSVTNGKSLVEQGDESRSITVLLSGWAFRQQNLPDGKRQILDFVLPGSLLGFSPGTSSAYGIETVTPCVVAILSLRQFYDLLSRIPSLAVRLAEILAEGEMRAYTSITNLGRRSARERVAGFILRMMERAHTIPAGKNGLTINLPITQVAMADALGLSNEHVCRTLGKLSAEGRISMKGHAITVLDIRGLRTDAGAECKEQEPEKQYAIAA